MFLRGVEKVSSKHELLSTAEQPLKKDQSDSYIAIWAAWFPGYSKSKFHCLTDVSGDNLSHGNCHSAQTPKKVACNKVSEH